MEPSPTLVGGEDVRVVIFLGLLVNTLIEDPATSLIGLSVPAVGVLFYIYFTRRNKLEESN